MAQQQSAADASLVRGNDPTHLPSDSSYQRTTLEQSATFPDGGYGWVCVASVFVINSFTWGVVASFGVYLSYYLSEINFPGAQAFDYALVGGFNYGAAMLVAPVAISLGRKCGIHTPMTLGVLMLGSGFICASFASTIWQLYLSQGVLVGLGVGLIYVPSTAIISQWFEKRRSLANAISAAGSGIGGLIFSLATGPMIRHISLGWSLRITGILAVVMNLAAVVLIRDRNSIFRPPALAFDTELLKRREVVLLLAWAFISMLGYTILQFSLSDFARSQGISNTQANEVTAFLNLGTASGRPFIGILSDRFGRFKMAGLLTIVTGISSFAIWLPSGSFGVTVLFAILVGATYGVFWATIGALCAEISGVREQPSILSLAWLTVALPTLFAEVIALELRMPQNDRPYLYPQVFTGLSYIIASLFLYPLRNVGRNGS